MNTSLANMTSNGQTRQSGTTYAQQGLWFLDRVGQGGSAYNLIFAIRLSGPVDIERLREAFRLIALRHDIFRTRFINIAGQLNAVLEDEGVTALEFADVSGSGIAGGWEAVRAAWGEEEQRVFDLSVLPLVRARLLKVADEDYVLLHTAHHIVWDGWSESIFRKELATLYECTLVDMPFALGDLPISYGSYALGQQGTLTKELIERELVYWRQQLKDAPAMLSLPYDRPRPQVLSGKGDLEEVEFDAELLCDLRRLCVKEQATLYVVLLAAFSSLIARWANISDLIVGSPTRGRLDPPSEALIGLFVNMLAIRTFVSADASASSVIQDVKQAVLAALEHQQLPFGHLVQDLKPKRDLSHHPIFQIDFTLYPPKEELRIAGLKCSELSFPRYTAKLDLSLHLGVDNDRLRGLMEYSTDLFERQTIHRLIARLAIVLKAFASVRDTRIADIDILLEQEREVIGGALTGVADESLLNGSVHELVHKQARLDPAGIAVESGEQKVTYGDLDQRATRLARYLIGVGVVRGALVAQFMDRSVEAVVGMLAIQYAGGVYLPIDINAPTARLSEILEEANPAVILTAEAWEGQLPATIARLVSIDKEWSNIEKQSSEDYVIAANPQATAYVIYTSGSTGRPKGVVVSHRALTNVIRTLGRDYELSQRRGVALLSPLAFDPSIGQVFLALTHGCRLIVISHRTATNSASFWSAVRRHQVDFINYNPSPFEEFLRAVPPGVRLRHLVLGGEPFSARLAKEIRRKLTVDHLVNTYGPTEACIYATVCDVQQGQEDLISIGKPIANTKIYILDTQKTRVPIGARGELYIGGASLAEGYLCNEDLTAEKFITYGAPTEERLYRTGDIARLREDGNIEYVGRLDTQIKLRGFRIELGEIEQRLLKQTTIKQAVVVVRGSSSSDRRLIAYLVTEDPEMQGGGAAVKAWVHDWTRVFDAIYRHDYVDAGPSFVGWKSTVTNEELPSLDMAEWLENTCDRLRQLAATRVLEIGCGNGLLLQNMLEGWQRYYGIDISLEALERVQRWVAKRGDRSKVTLRCADALGVEEIDVSDFDGVILNSVVQYFPSVQYLEAVLREVESKIAPRGKIFIGDVRPYSLRRLFYTGVEFLRASPNTTVREICERIASAAEAEKELTADPEIFAGIADRLSRHCSVQFSLRRGRRANELVKYRYDVVIALDTASAGRMSSVTWDPNLTREMLRVRLMESGADGLVITGIPNRRLSPDVVAHRLIEASDPEKTIGQLRNESVGCSMEGEDPEEIWRLAEEANCEVQIIWSPGSTEGCFDATFSHRENVGATSGSPSIPTKEHKGNNDLEASPFALSPLSTAAAARLIRQLRITLAAQLPEYMVPAAFVILSEFPLTYNGKVDRDKLPEPGRAAYTTAPFDSPRGTAEITIAEIWREELGVSRVSRNDSFFDLGGHSLLAIRVLERMREVGLLAEIQALFATPVLSDFSASVSGGARLEIPKNGIPDDCVNISADMLPLAKLSNSDIEGVVARVPGGAKNIQDIYPLAPIQQGMLFHHLMGKEGKGDPYVIWSLLAFDSKATLEAYVHALERVVNRHDILRTAVLWEGLPEPVQVVFRLVQLAYDEVALDPADGDVADQLLKFVDPRHCGFDISTAPLIRMAIARDSENGRWVMLHMCHHLIDDATSFLIMQDEVRAIMEGREKQLPAALPFRNFVAQAALGADPRAQELYFRDMLHEVREPTAPYGIVDVQGDGSTIEEVEHQVPEDLVAQIRLIGRSLDISSASIFHVAWAMVVGKTSDCLSPVLGTILFGRMNGGEGAARVLGPFINTLPLRVHLGGVGVTDCLIATHRSLSELLRHELAPLSKVQRWSGVPAPLPLFTTLLNYRHQGGWEPNIGHGVSWIGGEDRTNYPLMLSVDDAGDCITLRAQCVRPISPASICGMMHKALDGIVDAVHRNIREPIGGIDIITTEERRRQINEWNRTERPYSSDACIHELIEQQVALSPLAISVSSDSEELTYAALNDRANRLARYLIARGVGPDVIVGVSAQRVPEIVVGVLAILKAGGAYLPLDLSDPPQRVAKIVEASRLGLILATDHLADELQTLLKDSGSNVQVLDLKAEPELWARFQTSNIKCADRSLTASDLAYVIFTSGSSGTPKGVMVEHRSLVNRIQWMQAALRLDVHDVVLQKTPHTFDVSVWELMWPLTAGARMVLARPEGHKDPDYLKYLIQRANVSVIHFVPSMLSSFLEHIDSGMCESLRIVICSGEELSSGLARRLHAKLQQCQLYNLYGPTEATIDVTSHLVTGSVSRELVPIGRPIANTRMYILDAFKNPVPVGAPGELYIGGDGVARGYLNRPDLTSERFIVSPFDEKDRLYRTGDRARFCQDGEIEFLGRLDFQVKIRGYRIELGEIEVRLRTHPAVRDVVVVVDRDASDARRLVAYYSTQAGESANAGELRRFAAEALPEYMVPAAYVRLEELPLSSSGKVERRLLPVPEEGAFSREIYEAPVGAVESRIAEIWQEVFDLARIGRRDNFFNLGGHSLLAIRVVERMRRVGLRASIRALFDHPVLANLSVAVERTAGTVQKIPVAPRSERLPASFAQKRLWFLARILGGDRGYHISIPLRLHGPIDKQALRWSLNMLMRRHESLRTTFFQEDGEVFQQIGDSGTEFLILEETVGAEDLQERLAREAFRDFDLEYGPVIRGLLLSLGPRDTVFVMTMHHIISDGWSVGILIKELSRLYAARTRGLPDPLGLLEVQYADYSSWQRATVTEKKLSAQKEFWKRFLADAPTHTELPTERAFGEIAPDAGGYIPIMLEQELSERFKAVGIRYGMTPFMVVLTGWAVLLARLSNADEVVIGTPVANRSGVELEGVVGLFVNTLVCRISIAGEDLTVEHLLERVKRVVLDVQENQDLPFEQIVDLVNPPRSVDRNPLFQVLFNWQDNEVANIAFPGLAVERLLGGVRVSKFDLALEMGEDGNNLKGGITYSRSLFGAGTIVRWSTYFRRILEGIVEDVRGSVAGLSMLSAEEKAQVLVEMNRTLE